MRNVALTVAYRGTAYSGWQYQPAVPTVQGAIEAALSQVTGESGARVRGAGRTDAGVHARAQVANVRLESNTPCEELQRSLNALLPTDIVIRDARVVSEDFESRRDNGGKHYRYSWWNRRQRHLDHVERTDHAYRPFDLSAMALAAQSLVGTHDFRAFRAADCDRETTTRTIYRCTIAEHEGLVLLDVEGTAFLKNMVRIVAGTLAEVGAGKRDPNTMTELLTSGDRTAAGATAPAKGLTLLRVYTPWTIYLDL